MHHRRAFPTSDAGAIRRDGSDDNSSTCKARPQPLTKGRDDLDDELPELVYEEALAVELTLRRIPFVRQPPVRVCYKGQSVGFGRPDFIVDKLLVVEIKAVSQLATVHQAQVISYLKALGTELGLLLNFRGATMRSGVKRVVWGQPSAAPLRQPEALDESCDVDHGLDQATDDTQLPL
jgi:GxxExxY protein